MNIDAAKQAVAAAFALFAAAHQAAPAPPSAPSEEVPIGFLPVEWISATLKGTLSPNGRYVVLSSKGAVRVYDSIEKIQQAKSALENLQAAPVTISFEITVRAGAHRVTRQEYPAEPQVLSYEIPVPQRYDPARIVEHGRGGITIVPGLPRDFTSRHVEPGAIVNTSPDGYRTITPEVRLSESSLEGGVVRKFLGSVSPGKPAVWTVSRFVTDPVALQEWAVSHGIVPDKESSWSAAGAELVVNPALSNGCLTVQAVPQIVIYGRDRIRPLRRIPVTTYATNFLAQRGTPMPMQTAAPDDPEFDALFFGAPPAQQDSQTIVSVGAKVQYLPRHDVK